MAEFHKYCPLTFCQETPYLGKNNERFFGYLPIFLEFTWGSFLSQRDLMLISRVRGSLPQELHSRSPFLGLDLLKLGARGDIILIEILQRLSLLQQGT